MCISKYLLTYLLTSIGYSGWLTLVKMASKEANKSLALAMDAKILALALNVVAFLAFIWLHHINLVHRVFKTMLCEVALIWKSSCATCHIYLREVVKKMLLQPPTHTESVRGISLLELLHLHSVSLKSLFWKYFAKTTSLHFLNTFSIIFEVRRPCYRIIHVYTWTNIAYMWKRRN